ncbi:MAG: ACP S-malonyltransferase [Candidatus Cryptobacteroides sp.]
MSKAYIFPGQGSQFSGMGRSLYESSKQARELMEEADKTLGFKITDIMFNGSAEDLKRTEVTQPAIFIHSTALALCSELPRPDMVAGHSLGELSALCVAEVLDFEEALRLVAFRAAAMSRCCEKRAGGMAAIIGLEDKVIEECCAQVQEGLVVAANYNCKGQVVISGEAEAVKAACERLKELGARRALPLAVSGAFHSALMQNAAEELAEMIATLHFKDAQIPVYQNVNAQPERDAYRIKTNLLAQLTSPVLWTKTVENMLADGADYFLEIGPGNVLQGLVRRIAGAEVTIDGIQ